MVQSSIFHPHPCTHSHSCVWAHLCPIWYKTASSYRPTCTAHRSVGEKILLSVEVYKVLVSIWNSVWIVSIQYQVGPNHIAVESNPHRLIVLGNLQDEVGLVYRIEQTGQICIVCLALPPRLIPPHLLGHQFVGVIAKFVKSLRWHGCRSDYNPGVFVNKKQQKSFRW